MNPEFVRTAIQTAERIMRDRRIGVGRSADPAEDRARLEAAGFEWVEGYDVPNLLKLILPAQCVRMSSKGELWFKSPLPDATIAELVATVIACYRLERGRPREFRWDGAEQLTRALAGAKSRQEWQEIIEAERVLRGLEE